MKVRCQREVELEQVFISLSLVSLLITSSTCALVPYLLRVEEIRCLLLFPGVWPFEFTTDCCRRHRHNKRGNEQVNRG